MDGDGILQRGRVKRIQAVEVGFTGVICVVGLGFVGCRGRDFEAELVGVEVGHPWRRMWESSVFPGLDRWDIGYRCWELFYN
jgi:hypothetical protein